MNHDIRNKRLRGVSTEDETWLKEHTVKDLRNLCFEMYELGEDVSDMVPLVNYMESLETKLVTEQRMMSGERIDFDVLGLVEPESAYA